MTNVAGGLSTLRAYALRNTSSAHGSAVTSSMPGATCPAYFNARVAAVRGAFHQHCALAARKFCNGKSEPSGLFIINDINFIRLEKIITTLQKYHY